MCRSTGTIAGTRHYANTYEESECYEVPADDCFNDTSARCTALERKRVAHNREAESHESQAQIGGALVITGLVIGALAVAAQISAGYNERADALVSDFNNHAPMH